MFRWAVEISALSVGNGVVWPSRVCPWRRLCISGVQAGESRNNTSTQSRTKWSAKSPTVTLTFAWVCKNKKRKKRIRFRPSVPTVCRPLGKAPTIASKPPSPSCARTHVQNSRIPCRESAHSSSKPSSSTYCTNLVTARAEMTFNGSGVPVTAASTV